MIQQFRFSEVPKEVEEVPQVVEEEIDILKEAAELEEQLDPLY